MNQKGDSSFGARMKNITIGPYFARFASNGYARIQVGGRNWDRFCHPLPPVSAEAEQPLRMISCKRIGGAMKQIATVALMLNLGVAGTHAQQRPVRMTFSGTNVATVINLKDGTVTDETHLA